MGDIFELILNIVPLVLSIYRKDSKKNAKEKTKNKN
jgi:hypothetical protein